MCANNDCTDTSQITIPVGATGAAGTNGTNGAAGTNGTNGVFGGFSGAWVFNSTTSTGPAATTMRFNDTVLANVTKLYIHNANASGINYYSFLGALSNTINAVDHYGLIRVYKESDSTTFFYGKITLTTIDGSTRTVDVTHIQSNGTFTSLDSVVVDFAPNGESGIYDKEVLTANNTVVSTTNVNYVTLMSQAIAANTLVNDGDVVQIVGAFTGTNATIMAYSVPGMTIDSVDVIPVVSAWKLDRSYTKLKIYIELTKFSATEVFMDMKSYYIVKGSTLVPSFGASALLAFVSANSNTVVLKGKNPLGTATITADHLLIKKFNI